MNARAKGLLGVCLAAAFLASGCATVDKSYRGITSMTNPDKTTLRGGVKWMSPHPPLREVPPSQMVVYLRVRNTSGAEIPIDHIRMHVRERMEQAGYRVTNNVDEAQFSVRADVRHYGENATKDGGASMLTGAVLGGVTGAVVGHQVRSTGTSTGLGAAGGAVVGGAIGNIMANRNKMIEYNVLVDLRIGERIQGGVRTTRRSDDAASVHQTDRVAVAQGGIEGGTGRAGSSDEQRVEMQDDFLYHQNRLVAHAIKMGLMPDEALPYLSDRLSTALSNVLP